MKNNLNEKPMHSVKNQDTVSDELSQKIFHSNVDIICSKPYHRKTKGSKSTSLKHLEGSLAKSTVPMLMAPAFYTLFTNQALLQE